MEHINTTDHDASTISLALCSPASSWFTTAPSRSPRRSCGACLRTGKSPGPSPPCLSSIQSVVRWCRPSTRTTTRLPACPSCRHRRELRDYWVYIEAQLTCTYERVGYTRIPMLISRHMAYRGNNRKQNQYCLGLSPTLPCLQLKPHSSESLRHTTTA